MLEILTKLNILFDQSKAKWSATKQSQQRSQHVLGNDAIFSIALRSNNQDVKCGKCIWITLLIIKYDDAHDYVHDVGHYVGQDVGQDVQDDDHDVGQEMGGEEV